MGDDVDVSRSRLRKRLEKLLADIDGLLADAEGIRKMRPRMAHQIAPDEMADLYPKRQWARKALAALYADEPLPPMP